MAAEASGAPPPPGLAIRQDDLTHPRIHALLRLHLSGMHAASPPGSVHALDLSDLRRPGVTVWSAWIGDHAAGVAALRHPGGAQAEVKSMRTHPDFLRRGVAAALLDHVIEAARRRGAVRLSLETGSGAAFEPALALYRRRGFLPGEAFGDYGQSAFNQFLHLTL